MRQKKFLVLSLVIGVAVLCTTAFASAGTVWTVDNGLVKKVLTVGSNSNNGQLLVKGFIRNPIKGKKVYIKDHMKVQGNVQVGGVLQGNNIVSADNLGTGVVTETKLGTGAVTADKLGTGAVTSEKIADDAVNADKLDMSINGVVKASAYILDGGTVSRSFNYISTSTITATNPTTGQFVIDFGADVSTKYVQAVPLSTLSSLFPVIQSLSGNRVTLTFYDEAGTEADPTGFYITVY